MDPDPDRDPGPAIFVIDLQDANKNQIFFHKFFYFLKVHLHNFSKIKSQNPGSRRPKNIRIRNTVSLLFHAPGVSLRLFFF